MKYIGHPILGDGVYGNSYMNKVFESKLSRQFLHARSLEFDFKKKHFRFEAELPEDLQSFLDVVRGK